MRLDQALSCPCISVGLHFDCKRLACRRYWILGDGRLTRRGGAIPEDFISFLMNRNFVRYLCLRGSTPPGFRRVSLIQRFMYSSICLQMLRRSDSGIASNLQSKSSYKETTKVGKGITLVEALKQDIFLRGGQMRRINGREQCFQYLQLLSIPFLPLIIASLVELYHNKGSLAYYLRIMIVVA